MPFLPRLNSLWRKLFHNTQWDQDLSDELDAYLDLLIDQKIAEGLTPEAARRAALVELGGKQQVKEQVREVSVGHHLEITGQDFRFALRMLRKHPGFSLVAILTLALGIGVNTALVTVFNAIAFRPLPVSEPDQIVKVYRKETGQGHREVSGSSNMLSYPEYSTYSDNAQAFSGLTAYADVSLTLGGAEAEGIKGLLVAGNYFSVLDADMALGRPLTLEECRTPGSSPVVVLSHRFWQRRFGADSTAIGKTVVLNRQPFTVVGVTAHSFHGAELFAPDLWVPITMQALLMPGHDYLPNQNLSWLEAVGRLKPGVSSAQAQAELTLLAAQLDLASPGRKTQMIVTPGNFLSDPERREGVMGVAALLLAAVSLVLLIACANLANLSLA